MQQVSHPRAEAERLTPAQQRAGWCLRASAVLMGCYSAFMFCLAYMSAEQMTGRGFKEDDSPGWVKVESNGWALLTSVVIGWLLSVLARGLWEGRLWACLISFLGVSAIGLFYLANCTQFGWFSAWLLPIPAMLALLLGGLPAVRLGVAESKQDL